MIPARQASLRARPGLIRWPVSELRCLQPAHQGVHGHGDHDRGRDAAGLGEPVGGVGLDVLRERLPQPVRRGRPGSGACPSTGARCFGAAIASSVLLQHRAVQGGDREPAVAPPVPVLDHPEQRGRLRLPLLASRGPGLRGPRRPPGRSPPGSGGRGSAAPGRRGGRRTRPGVACASTATRGSRSAGSASTAATITWAWSTSSRPSASATRVGSNASDPNAAASRVLRCAAARVCFVACAHQFAVEVAPESASTSTVWPWWATRSCSSAIWASSRVSSTIASRVSAGLIDQAGASRTVFRMSWIWAAADRIGCPRSVVSAVLAMTPIRPPSTDNLGHVDRVCGRPPQRRRLWTPSGLFARG